MERIRNFKKECGSVTVETALFMIIFLGFYLAILNYGRLAFTEIVMQQALDTTAMQISQYSYILTKIGAVEKINQTSADAESTKTDIQTVTEGVSGIYSAFADMSDGEVTVADMEGLMDAVAEGQDAWNVSMEAFKDPEGLLKGLLAVGKEGIEQTVMQLIVGKICQAQIESYLETFSSDPDRFLRGLGVVDGLDGIDYTNCSLIADQTQDVVVTVEFEVENPIKMFGITKRKVRLSASTRVW